MTAGAGLAGDSTAGDTPPVALLAVLTLALTLFGVRPRVARESWDSYLDRARAALATIPIPGDAP